MTKRIAILSFISTLVGLGLGVILAGAWIRLDGAGFARTMQFIFSKELLGNALGAAIGAAGAFWIAERGRAHDVMERRRETEIDHLRLDMSEFTKLADEERSRAAELRELGKQFKQALTELEQAAMTESFSNKRMAVLHLLRGPVVEVPASLDLAHKDFDANWLTPATQLRLLNFLKSWTTYKAWVQATRDNFDNWPDNYDPALDYRINLVGVSETLGVLQHALHESVKSHNATSEHLRRRYYLLRGIDTAVKTEGDQS